MIRTTSIYQRCRANGDGIQAAVNSVLRAFAKQLFSRREEKA